MSDEELYEIPQHKTPYAFAARLEFLADWNAKRGCDVVAEELRLWSLGIQRTRGIFLND